MKQFSSISFVLLLSFTSCGQNKHEPSSNMESRDHKFTNELIHESSPYLLQHAHNPVNWYPWGKEALAKAKKENKLLIISVGYAACHWCHVMEHESFENEEVAALMNEKFVCIKVDREERPDIDQVYMNAVQLITGRGGWPLNCIALPDGRPLYGGTYFPKEKWMSILSQVAAFAEKTPAKAEEEANKLTHGVQSSEQIVINPNTPEFTIADLDNLFSKWKNGIDYVEGGQHGAPKFPLPVGYQFMLTYNDLTNNPDALKAVNLTLNKMADGGIYDQIGGGFARYSTDAFWKIPHFEKMLYDNSQLVSLYANAYQQSNNPYFKTIVEETLTFIERELTAKNGGFYSSLDADSEGVEGKYYVWTKKEFENLLGDDAEVMMDYYNITANGNWEHGNNNPFKTESDSTIAARHKLSEEQLVKRIIKTKKTLLEVRSKRIAPGLDDKILTSWNGLMLKGYVDAYRALGNDNYLKKALKNANFISTKLKTSDNRLYRNYKNETASINGFLDDYAFTISGFIALYQATFDERWLNEALALSEYTLVHFYDPKSAIFFYTSNIDPALIARKMEISDNVIPAATSEMAKNLYVLGNYYYKTDYIDKAKTMLNNVKQNCLQSGPYYANWDILMAWMVNEPFQVCIVGKDADKKRKELNKLYLPFTFISGSKTTSTLPVLKDKPANNETTIYVCKDKVCQRPVMEVEEALDQMK